MDLASGHVAALDKGFAQQGCHVYNLGTGKGTSVLELVRCVFVFFSYPLSLARLLACTTCVWRM